MQILFGKTEEETKVEQMEIVSWKEICIWTVVISNLFHPIECPKCLFYVFYQIPLSLYNDDQIVSNR